jgi:hypothetical protein
MPLLGQAAMLLSFDIAPEAIAEHDDWHTHEHLPERLSIPGFLRGTRWVALEQGPPRYCVLYEVERLETLVSPAYLERLNHPTAWTTKMMPHYRGMSRGLCAVAGSAGFGLGHVGLLCRFGPAPGRETQLDGWLTGEILPGLPARPGLGSVHLLKSAVAPPMTHEQRIRGADVGVDWALLVTGYEPGALADLAGGDLGAAAFEAQGAAGAGTTLYRSDYSLAAAELVAHA